MIIVYICLVISVILATIAIIFIKPLCDAMPILIFMLIFWVIIIAVACDGNGNNDFNKNVKIYEEIK